MGETYPYWLSEQMLSGVRRFNIDSFLVALEGWRRGLGLTFYGKPEEVTDLKLIGFEQAGKTFSLTSGNDTHFFYRSRGDKVSNQAVDIGTSKQQTKQYLKAAGVSCPDGFEFSRHDDQETAIQSALQMGFPLVLKPTYGSLGKGVVTNIQTEQELRGSLADLYATYDYDAFIIEQYITGEDARVYVIGEKIVGATKRVPANITGDGVHTIHDLIGFKNDTRKQNPQTATRLIAIDQPLENHLARQNRKLPDIPEKNELIYVKGQSNISSGGDSIDVTNDLAEHVKDIAIQAVQAVPGLYHAGVDLIMNAREPAILEINSTAGISLHTFPLYGEQQNIAEKIIDDYFPETKGSASDSTKMYFDYKTILDLLRSNAMKQLDVTDAPVGELHAKRYVVSGQVQDVGYRKWIQKQAIARGLHGYARNLHNGNVVVVVAGAIQADVNDFKEVCREGPENARVEGVKDYVWDKQIKAGFELRRMEKPAEKST